MLHDLTLPMASALEASAGFDARDTSLAQKGHVGTHLDKVQGSVMPLEYFRSRALLFDVSPFCRERQVEPEDMDLAIVAQGDFVLIRTGLLQQYGYGSTEYNKARFELSWELIGLLREKRLRFVGVDARGLRLGQDHRKADSLFENQGAYVIENLNALETLPALTPFTIYTAPFDTGDSGVPCRVIAETAD